MIRRTILTAVLLATAIATLSAPAQATTPVPKVCDQRAVAPAGVKALIRCASPRMGVSTSTALAIAWRESNYKPWAFNQSSKACGVFQFVPGTWSAVVRLYLYGHSLGPVSCTNGRMNVFMALRYVKHGGWGPWS